MQSRNPEFIFSSNFNFGTDSIFTIKNDEHGSPFPPSLGNFQLLDGTPFLLLDNTNFLLL